MTTAIRKEAAKWLTKQRAVRKEHKFSGNLTKMLNRELRRDFNTRWGKFELRKDSISLFYPGEFTRAGGQFVWTSWRNYNDEAWCAKALIQGSDLDELDDWDIQELSGITLASHYSGPGRSFSREAVIERGPHSIKVSKMGGMDI